MILFSFSKLKIIPKYQFQKTFHSLRSLRTHWYYIGQKQGGDFAKFSGLLRIYELYQLGVVLFSYDLEI